MVIVSLTRAFLELGPMPIALTTRAIDERTAASERQNHIICVALVIYLVRRWREADSIEPQVVDGRKILTP
ncbi:hypothetical protein ACN42_g2726 [Penicillium freii]|uniref:Uncharacterized protein n=1 Tax=Penicillium freii TaxID=48697 RepID=A0A101MPL5_PENFR|nr:hypothetical protein ACN42_g2726 [Penicillium freii]